ncbi:MAG: hypothetical protein ABR947_02965 [Solirubrobacteraceae bacterium]|jgi:hypothetical protein
MTNPLSNSSPRRRVRALSPFTVALVAAGTLAASFALLAMRPPSDASAWNQAYNCESFVGRATCNLTAGSWHNITNVGGSNYTVAGDLCVEYGGIWGGYTCLINGYSLVVCNYTYPYAPVYAYGISLTQYGDNDNISGHEDDNSTCS